MQIIIQRTITSDSETPRPWNQRNPMVQRLDAGSMPRPICWRIKSSKTTVANGASWHRARNRLAVAIGTNRQTGGAPLPYSDGRVENRWKRNEDRLVAPPPPPPSSSTGLSISLAACGISGSGADSSQGHWRAREKEAGRTDVREHGIRTDRERRGGVGVGGGEEVGEQVLALRRRQTLE